MSESIGMMDKAYFVGKGEILNWFNELLVLNLAKIEQCATGAVYCAVMDALFPGTFGFKKVKWGAKHEHEYVENYKVLQQAFDKNGIKRHIDVAKLIKARYLDNLEFCQWLKAYFEKNYNGEAYDALGRRNNAELFYILGGGKIAPRGGPQGGVQATTAAARPKPAARQATGGAGGASASGIGSRVGGGSSVSAASGAEVKKLQE